MVCRWKWSVCRNEELPMNIIVFSVIVFCLVSFYFESDNINN